MSTRWKPDTCGCVIVYDTDTSGPVPEIVNIRFEQTCPLHQDKLRYEDRYRAVLERNKRGR